jgi:hypothetical protein
MIIRISLVLLALLGTGGGGLRPSAAAAQESPAAQASPAPAPPSGPDPLLEFVPKEHVPADSAVSFPVDI